MTLSQTTRILLCSNSSGAKESLQYYFQSNKIDFDLFPTLDRALTKIESGRFDTLILAVKGEKDDLDQIEKLSIVKKLDGNLPIVVICEIDSIEVERIARLQGVFYYFVEPVNRTELMDVLGESIRLRRRKTERRMG